MDHLGCVPLIRVSPIRHSDRTETQDILCPRPIAIDVDVHLRQCRRRKSSITVYLLIAHKDVTEMKKMIPPATKRP